MNKSGDKVEKAAMFVFDNNDDVDPYRLGQLLEIATAPVFEWCSAIDREIAVSAKYGAKRELLALTGGRELVEAEEKFRRGY